MDHLNKMMENFLDLTGIYRYCNYEVRRSVDINFGRGICSWVGSDVAGEVKRGNDWEASL